MNFAKAQVSASEGAFIKRKLWDSWLHRDKRGQLHFVLPARLRKKLGTDYAPTKIDKTTNDWEMKR